MHDIKYLRENFETFKMKISKRNNNININNVLDLDKKNRQLIQEREALEKEVRGKLNIPFYSARPGVKYEHSMGQGNIIIPEFILRQTDKAIDEQHSLQDNCAIL